MRAIKLIQQTRGLMKKAQIAKVREKRFYLCEYTGAPIKRRYFFPGKKEKIGTFASLPIMLRHVHDTKGFEAYEEMKQKAEKYYLQPNIPLAPQLDAKEVPLSKRELKVYMEKVPMGLAWLKVEKALRLPKLAKKP